MSALYYYCMQYMDAKGQLVTKSNSMQLPIPITTVEECNQLAEELRSQVGDPPNFVIMSLSRLDA